MNDDSTPRDIDDYLYRKLASLHPNARLVFVFDPPGRLALPSELDVSGRPWPLHRYQGNDLALRAGLAQAGWNASRPGGRVLIWVTAPGSHTPEGSPRIRLSSLTDLLMLADEILDLSLGGVLAELIPNAHWPADALSRHEDVFTADLRNVVSGHAELRRYLPRDAVLDANAVRALALHVKQPGTPVGELLFAQDSAGEALRRYIRLAWSADWDEEGRALLREHARASARVALGDVAAWFEPSLESLAVYVYLRRLLGQAHVPNIANQVRGLGILDFDPEPLERWVEVVLGFWERDAAWRNQVITRAEEDLTDSDLQKATGLLSLRRAGEIEAAIGEAETPAAVYQFTRALLEGTPDRELGQAITAWPAHRPRNVDNLPDTHHRTAALALVGFMDEAAGMAAALAARTDPPDGISGILDWYVAGRYYDLEYACAHASNHLRRLPDRNLERRLRTYLDDLRRSVRAFLGEADEKLAGEIKANPGKYLNDPRLSTRVLWDFIRQKKLRPNEDACVWVVIFDGMRWDTWQRVVKPRLLQTFEIKISERAYLSLLPSWTPIARTGLLAGRQPAEWKGYDGRATRNQGLLAALLFEIPSADQAAKLQFYSGMESDQVYRKLDTERRRPWNVLIFNISDDGLHQERNDLVALNEGIRTKLESIMLTLDGLVQPQDTVIVSSDHGFVELENDEQGVTIPENDRLGRQTAGSSDPVRYRYIVGVARPEGLEVKHPGLQDSPFTVAVGRRWFRRDDGRNQPPDRYAHGGLSLAEMVVPGVALRRIAEKKLDLVFVEPLTQSISIPEDTPLVLEIVIKNEGNQTGEFALEVKANTDSRPQTLRGKIEPLAEWRGSVTVQPVYREKGGSTSEINFTLTYTGPKGRQATRRRNVPVEVVARRDRIGIEFGGLDELDTLG
jgi:hypothetical protein